MEDSLKKRYIIKLFSNIISGIIGAIIVAIVPKALGPIVYGQFTFIQNFYMQIIAFLDAGSSIAFFTKLSARHDRKELIKFYLIYSLFLLLAVFGFIYTINILELNQKLLPDIPNNVIYLGLVYGFLIWFTSIYMKISDAYALTASVEFVKVIHKILTLFILLFLVFYTSFDLSSYFYFHYFSLTLFLFILSYIFIKKNIFISYLLFLKLDYKNLTSEFIEFCSPLVVYSIFGLIVGFLDIWLLQKFGGSIQTGFYGLAYSIAAMCFLFTSAMTPLITREFSKSYELKDLEKMKKLFSRYIPMLYSITAFFGVFISFQSENLLLIFTDDRFKNAYLVLVLMGFYPIHQTFGQLSGSIFYATGQTRLYKNIGIIGMSIGLFFSFLLIYILDLGAIGLAWKMIIGQLISVNIQLYFNCKLLNLKIKTFIFHQVYAVILFVMLASASSIFINYSSPLLSFIVSGLIYTALAIIFAYIFPQVFSITRDEINTNLTRFKNVIKK